MDLSENAVFMLSCGRVKTELFENADISASIYTHQSMRSDLWGSRKGILIVCFLLSNFEQWSLNAEASSCGRGYFRKRFSCGRGYFYVRIKKIRFQEYPDTCGRGLTVTNLSSTNEGLSGFLLRCLMPKILFEMLES